MRIQCKLLPLGLTLRLKGKETIPDNGEVVIDDLPVGGCRRYDTLECLSDVKYQGAVEKAYWKYTDTTLKDYLVEDIHCKGDECKNPDIAFGWQSSRGIYRNGSSYYGVVRLGRTKENAEKGVFTCYFEEDSNSPVSVNIIVECEVKIIMITSRLYIVKQEHMSRRRRRRSVQLHRMAFKFEPLNAPSL